MPVDAAGGRHVCTKENPWTPEKGSRALHPDAVNDYDSEDCEFAHYTCPHCGRHFYVELPQ